MMTVATPAFRPPKGASGAALLGGLALLFAAAGCTIGPDYRRTEARTPQDWIEPAADKPGNDAPKEGEWWLAFDDPALTELIEMARKQNLSIAEARARLAEARAAVGVARAGLLPSLNASGGATGRRVSSRQFEDFPLPPGAEPERNQTIYEAALDASWEIDLFGANRQALEAAKARLGGREAALRAARLSVTSEMARAYLEYRGAIARREALERAIDSQAGVLSLVEHRRKAGLATRADVARARAVVENTRANLPSLRAEVRSRLYQLGVLASLTPAQIDLFLNQGAAEANEPDGGASAAIPEPNWIKPAELPLAVLRKRPDVQAAERALAASSAEASSAATDLYPRINLSAALFSESDTPGGLDASANQGYSLVGGVLAPLWQGGRLRARLDAAEASRDAAEASFQQVVLVALADVESALVSYREALAALERQRIARAASAESTRLTRDLYEAGLAELITLTEAEARLAESDSALASSRTNAATSAVALNKALGGVDDRGVDSAADLSTTSVE